MTFEVVRALAEQKQHDEALGVAAHWLNKHPEDAPMMYMAGRLMLEKGWTAIAKPLCATAAAMSPQSFEAWNLLGNAHVDLWELEEGYEAFRTALQMDHTQASPLLNMAQAMTLRGKPEKAIELGLKALRMKDDPKGRHNLGMAKLMLRDWSGWELYEQGVGIHDSRKELVYGDEPRWCGHKDQTVVVYGEQGIGDEISFASCIPDLVRDSKKVVIDCDSRLEGLFKRSFQADVYGTRYRTGDDWPSKYEFDGRVAISALPKFYRTKDTEFPGKPYLVADPERRTQWKALLDQLPGKRVGIAWTGGAPITGRKLRSLSLEDLLPILKLPCSFVSLEYKDPTDEIRAFTEKHGIKIHEWGRATRTQDYDDTAALVAQLDLVITVTTSVVHLAGALGKECWVLTHKNPMWRYGLTGEDMLWYRSVRLFRQKTDWAYPIHRVAEELSKRS